MKGSNIKALELRYEGGGRTMALCPTLIWDENDAVLIDTGHTGFFPALKKAVEELIPFDRINHLILTHHDIDHIGCLTELKEHFGGKLKVVTHRLERPFIEGDVPPLKSRPEFMARMNLSEEAKAERMKMFANPPKAKVDIAAEHGDVLPVCGGLEIVFTPGHTHGHICIYHRDSKTLITGDAMNVRDGKLCGPNEMMTEDFGQALESLSRLREYDISAAICHHGGLFTGDVAEALRAIV